MAAPENDKRQRCFVVSNELLKLKFRKLHMTIIHSVDATEITNFLFQEGVLGAHSARTLMLLKNDPEEQCSQLLALLHTSEHPEAFLQLYRALQNEPHLEWLVRRIDEYTDQEVINLLQQQQIGDQSAGEVVHTLPEGEPVLGVTSLAGEIYLLRQKERDQVEVYDVTTYCLLRCLTVPNSRGFMDMTSCPNRCVYIGDHICECVHRLDAQGAFTQWAVNDRPQGLSVNTADNVLVTCNRVRKIKEFTSHGELKRQITLPDDVINPCHAIQTRSGQFIVCHGSRLYHDRINRVCMMNPDGRHTGQSHGEQPGSGIGQYNVPIRLAVAGNECVFVADLNNCRVTLLSPTLSYTAKVVSREQLNWRPRRVYFDTERQILYVADNEWNEQKAKFTAGRVVAFTVQLRDYEDF